MYIYIYVYILSIHATNRNKITNFCTQTSSCNFKLTVVITE